MKRLTAVLLFAVCSFNFLYCSKSKNDDPIPASREVTYDISGNYSGKLTIVYSNENGDFVTITNVSLPWSKKLTVQSGTATATITASTTSTSTVGVPGQTATAKILAGAAVKLSDVRTADGSGRIQIPSLVFTF